MTHAALEPRLDDVRTRLAAWLATVLPEGAEPTVVLHTGIADNGMSSETVLLDATWTEDGEQHAGQYVARVAPAAEDLPVFESYALQDQYDAIRIVGETHRRPRPAGPVDGADRRRARHAVLPDGPDRRRWSRATCCPTTSATTGSTTRPPRTSAASRTPRSACSPGCTRIPDAGDHVRVPRPDARRATRRWRATSPGPAPGTSSRSPTSGRSPIAERGLAWLEANLPDTARGGAVLGRRPDRQRALPRLRAGRRPRLGDGRVGPRELDVSWIVFAHRVFESITGMLELPGHAALPARGGRASRRTRSSPASSSATSTGTTSTTASQWCIVFMRTGARQIHFGEIERPDDIETLMHHKPLFESAARRRWVR